ncbi:MAG: AI-2E family transporter [Oscillospiraceae bacterium]|nr:AI-2E family transporter [Oscillospiraceae bacterium]
MGNISQTPRGRRDLYTRALLRIGIFAVIILLCALVVPRVIGLFVPFILSLMLAWGLNPIIRKTAFYLKVPRKGVTIVVLVLVFAAIVGLFFWITYSLVYEVVTLASNWEEHWQNFAYTVSAIEKKMTSLSGGELSTTELLVWEALDAVLSWLQDSLGKTVNTVVSISSSMISGVAGAAVALVAFIMSAYFITVDYPRLRWKLGEKLNAKTGRYIKSIKDSFTIIVGGYLKQQFFLSLTSGVIITVGFIMISQSYSLLLAAICAIVDFVPFFGAGTVLLPWALVCFLSERTAKGISILAIYVVVKAARIIMKRNLPRTKPGLTPVQLIVSLYAGFVLNGIIGIIWCPIVLMLFINFSKTGIFRNTIADFKAVIADIRAQTARE